MMSDIPRLIKHCLNPEWVKLQFKNEDYHKTKWWK